MLLNKEDSIVLLVDVQEKLYPAVMNSEAIISRCQWVLKLAKTLGVPILASEQYPQGLGGIIAPLSAYFEPQDCISKTHFSCMQEPNYLKSLEQFNKKQLILIGMETHVCVLQSALEMLEKGFEVFVVVDAVSSRNEVDTKYGLKRMKQAGVNLITAEMIFFEWLRKAGTEEFKTLSKAFLPRKSS